MVKSIKHSLSSKYPYHQSPRQETFWASAGFESTEKSVMLSDAFQNHELSKSKIKVIQNTNSLKL